MAEMHYSVTATRVTKQEGGNRHEVLLSTKFIIQEDLYPSEKRLKDTLKMCADASVLNKQIVLAD